jgi:uncharacterized protein YegP (UPF0339 family)
MRFELYQDEKEDWRWRLRDDGGSIVALSAEGYSNKKHAYSIIDDILRMDQSEIVDVRRD